MFTLKHIELAKRFFRTYPYTMDDLANVILRLCDLDKEADDNFRIIQMYFDMCLSVGENPWSHYKRISVEVYKKGLFEIREKRRPALKKIIHHEQ
ncbi:hypothetical protein [Chryseobacterium sp. Hurlbut01]|uniref:hypothetical protein n=1 Tax=Chryseobacterium sp. Hurlbut01 TaxID=1681828 RepID=UPI00128BD25C|nr:hypothetical protein [Chryseobacterium sp. Hurlbut01]